MDTQSLAASSKATALQQVWASPLYRGATLALFLSGVGVSASLPQIVVFLVKELGTSLPVAGLYYLTGLAAPVAGYLVGNYSDRIGHRLGLFRLCAMAGALGWAGFAVSNAPWIPFVIGAVVLGFSGSATSQLFTAIHDDLSRNTSGANESVVAIVRIALTAGWVVGPFLGTWLAAETSLRAMFWATSICFLAQIIPLGTLRVSANPKPRASHATGVGTSTRWSEMLPLLAFTGLYVLVYAGEPIKYGFLLLYMEERLGIDPGVRGAVIGTQPLIELLLMPFSVMLARRIGTLWLMCIAAAFGVVANLCFAMWPSAIGMFAGQVLMGGVWGLYMVLGLIVAQRLLPNAVATASAIFMSSSALASALGGGIGGVGVAYLGLPNVFYIPAAFSLVAVIGLAVMARRGIIR
ncbi:MFS transporter [Rhizobium rhizogenes]|uniref:MFS transporter n=1 Tax=Rhizobium rhizogenes TaxID=359 RepID=UPI001F196A05|nr:MFS transporter [Rhizobium rhizogenes]